MLDYLSGTLADALPEEVLWTAKGLFDWTPAEEGPLGLTIVYNVREEYGFVEYPLPGMDAQEE